MKQLHALGALQAPAVMPQDFSMHNINCLRAAILQRIEGEYERPLTSKHASHQFYRNLLISIKDMKGSLSNCSHLDIPQQPLGNLHAVQWRMML